MTIKQQGGVFGRNPTFNDVEVNTLTADGNAFVKAFGVNTTSLTSVSGFGFGSFSGSNGGGIVLQQNGTPKASIASFGNDQYIDAVGKTVIRTGATVTGAPVNVMEFQADRNVKMSAGNLIFLAGNGIDFSATSGTGTSELFDDYEEGTFTPDIVGSVSAGTGTYAYRIGRYTKIGDRVLFNLIMSWSAHTGTGFMRIDGLPFTSMASSPYYHAVNIGYIDSVATTAGTVPAGFIVNNSTQIWLGQIPTGGGSWSYIGIDTAGDINISGQYEV